ncbi:hypothetical protein [Halobacillus sp. BBL2006]|uniref:hypothetical protein n=1 Tax=Halobacillus sp. BBL2006 TaxID=1543706 RepID=UPI0005435006|nr:hypothetical protein [Halobacillus sp. BBL2006]KHE71792.1 hypothetical protein LD39_07910 [Halobacillus sp. BBL2006]
MAFTYGKRELIEDLQEVFSKHNVQSIRVEKPGTLFIVEADGSLSIGTGATIVAFDQHPTDKKGARFKLIDGGTPKK